MACVLLPAGGEHLRLNFESGAERERQVRLGVQRTRLQLLDRHSFGLLRICRLPDRTAQHRAPRAPSTSTLRDIPDRCRAGCDTNLVADSAAAKIVLHQRYADVLDNSSPGSRSRQSKKVNEVTQSHSPYDDCFAQRWQIGAKISDRRFQISDLRFQTVDCRTTVFETSSNLQSENQRPQGGPRSNVSSCKSMIYNLSTTI